MATKDLYSNILAKESIPPGLYKNSEDATGEVIDTQGAGSVTLILVIGEVTDAQALTVEKSAAGSQFADVVAADVVEGTDQLAAFKEIAANDDNKVKMLGFVGSERYLKVSCTGAGATGAVFGVIAVLGHTQLRPSYSIE